MLYDITDGHTLDRDSLAVSRKDFLYYLSKWAYAQTAALEGCFILAGEEVSGV